MFVIYTIIFYLLNLCNSSLTFGQKMTKENRSDFVRNYSSYMFFFFFHVYYHSTHVAEGKGQKDKPEEI